MGPIIEVNADEVESLLQRQGRGREVRQPPEDMQMVLRFVHQIPVMLFPLKPEEITARTFVVVSILLSTQLAFCLHDELLSHHQDRPIVVEKSWVRSVQLTPSVVWEDVGL